VKQGRKYMNLLECSKASVYLRKRYKLGWFAFGNINLGTLYKIKDDLIKNHDKSQLRSIKASINSQVELYKQANLILPILVLIFTVSFSLATSFTSLAAKSLDLFPKDKNNYVDVMNAYNKGIKDAFNINSYNLICISLFMTVGLYLYLERYKRITLLNNTVIEALEEKDECVKEDQRKNEDERKKLEGLKKELKLRMKNRFE
jgi:hypothetical protein